MLHTFFACKQGIDLGSWSCCMIYDECVFPRVDDCSNFWSNGIQTCISQIKFLLGWKFSDPELQLELDYVPFRVIEGPDGCPLVHARCNGEDRAFTCTEILAMLISVITLCDIPSESCTSYDSYIGVPIYFSDQQKNEVLQAVKRQELVPKSYHLVDETTAMVAALEVDIVSECIVAFVDIGHASMRVCFAEFKGRHYNGKWPVNILYRGYAKSLGGREFDKILFKHFASQIRSEYNIDVYQNSHACLRLREACEILKHDLSKNNEASFCIDKLSSFIDVKGSITREEFETLNISVLEKIEQALMKALSESGLNAEKIDFVEAVGGRCSVPSVIKIMVKILGKIPRRMPYDSEHIASGCMNSQLWSSMDKTINHQTAGMSTVELVSCNLEVEEDNSDKLLWKRAMDKDGYSLPFLNDFLEKNMSRIDRTKKTEEESYWLSLLTKKTEEGSYGLSLETNKTEEGSYWFSKAGFSRSFWKAWFGSTDFQQNTEHPKTVQNDEAEKLIEQLKLERDNARKEVEELRRLNMEIPRSQYVEFSYSDLQDATNNFQDSLKLGEGGFGIVYKGTIHETAVAVKMLKDGSSQGAQEFNQEVAALSMVRHPNLVTLTGACSETRALIYEYLPQGSLEDHLRCKNNTLPLPWQARVRIAFEICTALSFLHHCKPHGLVHGDLKPDNILLDSNNISKISDFGLCRQLNWTDSASIAYHWTDCPKGTLAYMDPEYLSSGKITPQYDVHSFGIMLLRLVTCKEPRGLRHLVEEAKKKGTLNTLVDASAGPWPFKEANKMISLGLRCSDLVRKNRPDLSTKVLKEMKSMLDIASASGSS